MFIDRTVPCMNVYDYQIIRESTEEDDKEEEKFHKGL
jgi:hypothetical protein